MTGNTAIANTTSNQETSNTDNDMYVEQEMSVSLRFVQQSIKTYDNAVIFCVLVNNTATTGLQNSHRVKSKISRRGNGLYIPNGQLIK